MRGRTELIVWGVVGSALLGVLAAVWLYPDEVKRTFASALSATGVQPSPASIDAPFAHRETPVATPPAFVAPPPLSAESAADTTIDFIRAILGSLEDRWAEKLAREPAFVRPEMRSAGPAVFVWWDDAYTIESGCGALPVARGPFFCPEDHRIYMNPVFFEREIGRTGGALGLGEAYIVAHEYGHYIQELNGARVRAINLIQSNQLLPNVASARFELQADCYAGVWVNMARESLRINDADIDEALSVANHLGNDAVQTRWRGFAEAATFTHGTSAERTTWFRRGVDTGDLSACDTFAAPT